MKPPETTGEKSPSRFSQGFTLIELLIVVAIIAILAAIAVPNFLEAQTRSKVSRVQSDLRMLVTAVESYSLDNGCYPRNPPAGVCVLAVNGLPELTTPVAYIISYPVDIFRSEKGLRKPIQYGACSSGSTYWYVWSLGPDLKDQNATILYDPTNGTISEGDIKRSTAAQLLTTSPL
jgi:type II secretion system protein G